MEGYQTDTFAASSLNAYIVHLTVALFFQQFGTLLDVEIIFNEKGSKVSNSDIGSRKFTQQISNNALNGYYNYS